MYMATGYVITMRKRDYTISTHVIRFKGVLVNSTCCTVPPVIIYVKDELILTAAGFIVSPFGQNMSSILMLSGN